jgi:hypothetical protein
MDTLLGASGMSRRGTYSPETKADEKTQRPMLAMIVWKEKYNAVKGSLLSGKCRVLNVSEKFSNFLESPKTSENFCRR